MRVYFGSKQTDTPYEWIKNLYLKEMLRVKEHKRLTDPREVYSEDLWQGLTVEEYCAKYPIRINSKGHYANYD